MDLGRLIGFGRKAGTVSNELIHRPCDRQMNRRLQLLPALVGAIVIAAIGSHWLAAWLKIHTVSSVYWTWGKATSSRPAYLAGSSVADYGISWDQVSSQLGVEIVGWGIPGGSHPGT